MKPSTNWLPLAATALWFAVLALAETFRPLRRSVEPKGRRLVRNLGLAGIWIATLTALQTPLLGTVSSWAETHRIGLLRNIPIPRWVAVTAAVLLLDYTLWFWHWANHRIPLFWRFHRVHHVDRDLDTSTALRFHVGEMLFSIPYRLGQVLVIGADLVSVNLFQLVLVLSILFHHSNVRLPMAIERRVVWILVTPRMHGIHHSSIEDETNSNWSSLLSLWDYLHRTIRLEIPQDRIIIGVPAYKEPDRVTFGRLLALPFRKGDEDWSDMEGRKNSRRDVPHGSRSRLVS